MTVDTLLLLMLCVAIMCLLVEKIEQRCRKTNPLPPDKVVEHIRKRCRGVHAPSYLRLIIRGYSTMSYDSHFYITSSLCKDGIIVWTDGSDVDEVRVAVVPTRELTVDALVENINLIMRDTSTDYLMYSYPSFPSRCQDVRNGLRWDIRMDEMMSYKDMTIVHVRRMGMKC